MKKLKTKSTARDIAYIALSVSLITVCAWITIPIGAVPFTLQTLAVALVGAVLGWKRGCAAVFVYIFMGLVGIPVFSGFGATAKLFGATGGYIFGFLFLALLPALVKLLPVKRTGARTALFLAAMIVGDAICYFFGTVWFMVVYECTLSYALTMCVIPFLLPDLLKFVAAAALAGRLEKIVG